MTPEQRQEWIEDKANQLVGKGEFAPYDTERFFDGCGEASQREEDMRLLTEYLYNKDFEKLGRLVWSWSMKSAEDFAKFTAERLYERNEPWMEQ